MPLIKVSVQADPRDLDSWLALARRLEVGGFHALLIGDHPGAGASPWPSLGAAAAVTRTLSLGTYVLQAGIRDPVQSASDAATLDLLAPGRVLFGLGAGHTFREWAVGGGARPSAQERAERLVEFIAVVVRLLDGETVTHRGSHLTVVDARLDELPVGGGGIALVVGGGHRQILRIAAERARVVALSGLGRTLPDGHRHEVRWSEEVLQTQLDLIRSASAHRAAPPEVEALVQVVEITDDRRGALTQLGERVPSASDGDLATTPFVLIGSIEQMAAQLARQAQQLGITRYVVREPALDAMELVLPLLKASE